MFDKQAREPLAEALFVDTGSAGGSIVFLLGKTYLGEDQAIGEGLLRNWLTALAKQEQVKRTVLLFVNRAVLLTRCEGREGILLSELKEQGARIIADRHSLNDCNLPQAASMAEALNSLAIMDLLLEADKVITLP